MSVQPSLPRPLVVGLDDECRYLLTADRSLLCAAHPVHRPSPWARPTGCRLDPAVL